MAVGVNVAGVVDFNPPLAALDVPPVLLTGRTVAVGVNVAGVVDFNPPVAAGAGARSASSAGRSTELSDVSAPGGQADCLRCARTVGFNDGAL